MSPITCFQSPSEATSCRKKDHADCFAICVPKSTFRSEMATMAPSLATRSAMALPNPEAPPVTRATFPSSVGTVFVLARPRQFRRREESDFAVGMPGDLVAHVAVITQGTDVVHEDAFF